MKDKKEKPIPVYEIGEEANAFAILRNGRHLMTPAGQSYTVPSRPLADKIVEEWSSQGEKILPNTMPMTQLTATSLDIIGKDRSKTERGLIAYIATELLCHRVQTPSSLVEKQQTLWQPLVEWCQKRYDISFALADGVMPVAQHPQTTERLQNVLASYDTFHLAGLSSATDAAGSLILGLALSEGHATPRQIFEAAELDITHQARTWGTDPVTQKRQEMVLTELESCAAWFCLLGKSKK